MTHTGFLLALLITRGWERRSAAGFSATAEFGEALGLLVVAQRQCERAVDCPRSRGDAASGIWRSVDVRRARLPRHVRAAASLADGLHEPRVAKSVHFAMTEANRLGLEMSMNLSSCAGTLKGPWDVGDEAPKKLMWTSAEVSGPATHPCRIASEGHATLLGCGRVGGPAGCSQGGRRARQPLPSISPMTGTMLQTKPDRGSRVSEVLDLSDKVDAAGTTRLGCAGRPMDIAPLCLWRDGGI